MKSIKEIPNNPLGNMLRAAIIIINTEAREHSTPDEIINSITEVSKSIYGNAFEIDVEQSTFRDDITIAINKYSKETESNTPDYILADYLINSLDNYNIAISKRDISNTAIEF